MSEPVVLLNLIAQERVSFIQRLEQLGKSSFDALLCKLNFNVFKLPFLLLGLNTWTDL
jgi:hypothetical protein